MVKRMKANIKGGTLIQKNPDGSAVYRFVFVEGDWVRDVTVDAGGNVLDERSWLKEPPGSDPRTGGPAGNVEQRPL